MPETVPEPWVVRSSRRIANGEYMPRNVTGKNMMANEDARLPVRMSSKLASKDSSTGSENSGRNSRYTEPISTVTPSTAARGRRSASQPPRK